MRFYKIRGYTFLIDCPFLEHSGQDDIQCLTVFPKEAAEDKEPFEIYVPNKVRDQRRGHWECSHRPCHPCLL